MRTLTTLLLTLLLAATAQGKGVVSAKACGQDGCVPVAVDESTMLGGANADAPAKSAPFVRLRVKFGHPGAAEKILFVPSSGVMRFADDPHAVWMHMDAPEPWLAAARQVTPFGAAPPAPSAPVATTATTEGTGFPWVVVGAAIAMLALLGTLVRRKVYGLAGARLVGRGTGRARP